MNKFFWQYKKLDIKAKAVIWFTICSFLQKGISFITVPVFARIMPTSEYGLYTVYLSWLQILTIFTSCICITALMIMLYQSMKKIEMNLLPQC